MSPRLVVREHEESAIDLNTEDVAFLERRYSRQFSVHADPDGSTWVNPNQFVGVIGLPSGARLESRPKVPLVNIFHILAFLLAAPFEPEEAEYATIDDILTVVADHFAALLEERVRIGLYRTYITREENLAFVRGRVDFAADVRANHVLRHHTFCRFDEMSWDVLENQVLRQVARLLAGWGLAPSLTRRLARLDGLLEEIAPSRLTATDVSRFQYNRLTSDYQPLHALCRLFLEGASLFEGEGDQALPGFLMDMNSVFERFVTEVLRQQCPINRSVAAQDTVHLDEDRWVRTIPDIVLRAGKRPTGVADCKYKRLSAGDFINPDLFQLLTYCIILPVTRGLLIYPRHLCSLEEELQVRSSPIRLRLRTLDLGRPWPEVQINCRELAEATFGWLA